MWMNFLSLHFVEVYNLLILVVAKGYSGYAGKQLFKTSVEMKHCAAIIIDQDKVFTLLNRISFKYNTLIKQSQNVCSLIGKSYFEVKTI